MKYASVDSVEVCEVVSEWVADTDEYSLCCTAQGRYSFVGHLLSSGGSVPTVAERPSVLTGVQ